MNKEKKLYKVKSVDQETGKEFTAYYAAQDLNTLESEIADIIQIEILSPFEDLTP